MYVKTTKLLIKEIESIIKENPLDHTPEEFGSLRMVDASAFKYSRFKKRQLCLCYRSITTGYYRGS